MNGVASLSGVNRAARAEGLHGTTADVVEVVLSWGDGGARNVLGVVEVEAGGSIAVGEDAALLIPAAVLGCARAEIVRFLEDVNEPARFHAAATLLAQEDASALPALAKMLIEEESVRVRSKVAEGLAQRAWPLAEDARAALRNALPAGYALDGAGRVTKR